MPVPEIVHRLVDRFEEDRKTYRSSTYKEEWIRQDFIDPLFEALGWRWWGPKGFTTPFCAVDLREGGVFLYCMRSPEGRDFWGRGVFREIVVPERIVFAMSFADAGGNVVPATHYGMSPEWPLETLLTVAFEEAAGKTRATLRYEGVPPGADRDGTRQGWSESLERLGEYLAKA